MEILLHPHCVARMKERGITEATVRSVVQNGIANPAKLGRTSFRLVVEYNDTWRGRWYRNQEVVAIAAQAQEGWLVITAIAKYY